MSVPLFKSALVLHIAAGYAALVTGAILMILAKGGLTHVRLGRVFFASMMAVVVSAILLALVRDNTFLLQIGIFVFYQVFSGFRSARIREKVWARADVLLSVVAVINGGWMLVSGQMVLIVFGLICISLGVADVRSWFIVNRGGTLSPRHWLGRHIGMMTGSYIGTFTAFLVVNISAGPWSWIFWLAPTIVIVPLMQFWIRKYATGVKRTVIRSASMVVFICFSVVGQGQPYVDGDKTRHRFAQLCLGLQGRIFPAGQGSAPLMKGTNVIQQSMPSLSETRFVVAGTHFWGHADFYMTFPMWSTGRSAFRTSVETGFRVMPWQLRSGKLCPFVGAAWMPAHYQREAGPRSVWNAFPFSAGLFFATGRHLFEIGAWYTMARSRQYFVSRATAGTVMLPQVSAGIGYRLMLETTAGAERPWREGTTRKLTDSLAHTGHLNSITFAAGPSTSFFVRPSAEWQRHYPYAGSHYSSMVFPEISAGYYLHGADLQANIVFRRMRSQAGGHGYSQLLRREAFTIEAYHFFTDYHGFALFAGPAGSMETWQLHESGPANDESSVTAKFLAPGLTFGWDIRPDRLQYFYLRTALRYFPFLAMRTAEGLPLSLDQIEVNFIQLVFLPGRW